MVKSKGSIVIFKDHNHHLLTIHGAPYLMSQISVIFRNISGTEQVHMVHHVSFIALTGHKTSKKNPKRKTCCLHLIFLKAWPMLNIKVGISTHKFPRK